MGIPSPHTTPLELRLEKDGRRLMLYFDGRRVPGITGIKVDQEIGHRPVVTVSIIGSAVRFETDEMEPIPDDVYWSLWYPGFYAKDGSGEMGASFMRQWYDRRGEFPNE